MMDSSIALMGSILVPLVGAILLGLLAPLGREPVRSVALVITLLTLVLALLVVAGFDPAAPVSATSQIEWLPASAGVDAQLRLGLDGVSLWLYALSAVLMVSAVLVSWQAIEERASLFYGMLLLLEFGCLGVFAARDLLLFYVFFEFTLIPLFFLIGIWGSEQRRYAAVKFFIYTLAGSLLTFLGLLSIVLWNYVHQDVTQRVLTFSIPALTAGIQSNPMPLALQGWVFFALFVGFAIKVPLFPLHTWLPLAHVQAPTAGSVFLAGILLKIGTYGFLRFSIPMLPEATAAAMPWLLWLSVIGIIYGALVALAQSDMKRLIAYSSVSHLGFCTLGLFALTPLAVEGGALQMINHGISTGALFALVGMIYERYHTREIGQYGGLARKLPVLTFFMVLFTLSSIGLPGLNGFAGEILILAGMFQRGWMATDPQLLWVAVLAVSGVVLGAWYMLWLVQRVFFGPLKEPVSAEPHVRDLSLREVAALVPLAILVFWIGLYPKFFLDRMSPGLRNLTAAATAEAEASAAAQVASGPSEVH